MHDETKRSNLRSRHGQARPGTASPGAAGPGEVEHGAARTAPESLISPVADPTEDLRRERMAQLAYEAGSREALIQRYGQIWDTKTLSEDFAVLGFMAPYVLVRDKKTRALGTLEFQASPRFYFSFVPDEP